MSAKRARTRWRRRCGSSRRKTGATADPAGAIALGGVRQRGGKNVAAWAVPGTFDVATLVSNTFRMQWPKGGAARDYPEVDRAEWFTPAEARGKLVAAQAEFVDRLISALRERGHDVRG